MSSNPIDEAARIIGSQVALANALGVSKSAVNQWKGEGRQVPAEHCPQIERLTGGQVKCEDLNTEVDWTYLRNTPTPINSPTIRTEDLKDIDADERARNGGLRSGAKRENVTT